MKNIIDLFNMSSWILQKYRKLLDENQKKLYKIWSRLNIWKKKPLRNDKISMIQILKCFFFPIVGDDSSPQIA